MFNHNNPLTTCKIFISYSTAFELIPELNNSTQNHIKHTTTLAFFHSCLQSPHRYTCPRCQVPYCSIACYKSHSTRCVDEFNKEQVFDSLKSQKVTIGEKKEFEKILNKFHQLNLDDLSENKVDNQSEQSDIDEDRIEDLVQLAKENKLDLNSLNGKESKIFFRDLNSGVLKKYIGNFNPWWNKIISEEETEPIKHICCTNSRQANFRNSFTAIHLIYCYVHLIRSCHGNWSDDLNFTISHLDIACRPFLDESCPPESINETIDNILLLSSNNDYDFFSDAILNQICLVDIKQILSFKDFCLKSLKELKAIFITSQNKIKTKAKTNLQLQMSIRKLNFLCSFVVHHWDFVYLANLKLENLISSLDLLNLLSDNRTNWDTKLSSRTMI